MRNFDVKIMGCARRYPMVVSMCCRMGLDIEKDAYIDMEMSGKPVQTQMKALSIPFSGAETHRVLLQDDVNVGEHFYENIEHLIKVDKDAVWCLFIGSPRKHLFDKYDKVFVKTGGSILGQGILMPRHVVNDYTQWYNVLCRKIPYYADDAIMASFCKMNGIRVLTTIPSFIEHACNGGYQESALDHREGSTTSNRWDLTADVSTFTPRFDLSLGEYNGRLFETKFKERNDILR